MTDEYVAQLSLLRAIGKGSLPRVADGYAEVSRDVESSRASAQEAMGKSYRPWEDLAASLQNAAHNISDDLYDCGETLVNASTDFAKQDGVFGDVLDDYKDKTKVATQQLPRPLKDKHKDDPVHTSDRTPNDNPNMYGGES